MTHTPGPWTFRKYAISDEDIENCAKLGIEPVLMLSNDGQATVMAGDISSEDNKPIARVECQTKFKRGIGYKTKCDERDANALLIAAAPELLKQLTLMVEIFDGYQGMELQWAKDAIAMATKEKP